METLKQSLAALLATFALGTCVARQPVTETSIYDLGEDDETVSAVESWAAPAQVGGFPPLLDLRRDATPPTRPTRLA